LGKLLKQVYRPVNFPIRFPHSGVKHWANRKIFHPKAKGLSMHTVRAGSQTQIAPWATLELIR